MLFAGVYDMKSSVVPASASESTTVGLSGQSSSICVNMSHDDIPVCPVSTIDPECELLALPVSDFIYEMSSSSFSVSEPDVESSVCLVLPSVSGFNVSVLPDSVCELSYELSVCPISPNVSELELSVASREPSSVSSILSVMSSEIRDAFHL